jgi:hypothetical protein
VYLGPPIDDGAILERLPAPYRDLLTRANGYVAYHGGLHVRGACLAPEWHSLRAAWEGPNAIHRLFAAVAPDDIPFGQDALGDQFVIRNDVVHRLDGESGELESLDVDLADFDANVRADPLNYLRLHPLERFRADGGELNPGQLLSVYPPFCLKQSADGISVRAIPAADRLGFLASFAAQISRLPDGTVVTMRVDRRSTDP